MAQPSPLGLYLRVNQAIWKRLPAAVRDTRIARSYGAFLHGLVCRRAQRRQYFGTFFLRNRPKLEQIRRLIAQREHGATVHIAILGCSIGAEVYSVLWTIRSARPDLDVRTQAVDVSREVLEVAERGAYTSASSGLVGSSIFERLTPGESHSIFDWEGGTAIVKPWLRAGISWHEADVSKPELIRALGPQDIVVASNFLCHMPPSLAEACMRNFVRLLRPGGYLFVPGVDLEVRSKVARELGWQPVPDLIREIHDGDPSVRGDWPREWWGLEPLNDRRRDWQLRYAVAYRI
ncbi:MAG TPA: CheR family methyltransferase [Candidatus Dormibacteraeota bacterium]|nr:CheR family methyltransferase [Candidatus Dormibacteraeota bacterium]